MDQIKRGVMKWETKTFFQLPPFQMSRKTMRTPIWMTITEATTTSETIKKGLFMIKVADIQSVYSGINGRCCCGCSGKHSYASQYRELASKGIGYQVTCN